MYFEAAHTTSHYLHPFPLSGFFLPTRLMTLSLAPLHLLFRARCKVLPVFLKLGTGWGNGPNENGS